MGNYYKLKSSIGHFDAYENMKVFFHASHVKLLQIFVAEVKIYEWDYLPYWHSPVMWWDDSETSKSVKLIIIIGQYITYFRSFGNRNVHSGQTVASILLITEATERSWEVNLWQSSIWTRWRRVLSAVLKLIMCHVLSRWVNSAAGDSKILAMHTVAVTVNRAGLRFRVEMANGNEYRYKQFPTRGGGHLFLVGFGDAVCWQKPSMQ